MSQLKITACFTAAFLWSRDALSSRTMSAQQARLEMNDVAVVHEYAKICVIKNV